MANALEDSLTLPKGVRAGILIQGQVFGVEQKFSDEGKLWGLQGRFSKKINAKFLEEQLAEFRRLQNVLFNHFPKNYDIGEDIDLGNLEISGRPRLDVFAPVFAYGITENWSVGIGLPIVHLQADLNIRTSGTNNVSKVKEKVFSEGVLSQELNQAFDRLEQVDIVQEFYNMVSRKSFKPLRQVDEWVLGDFQIQSRWKYYSYSNWSFALKNHFNFATGPEDDPDDLLDVPIFHRNSIEVMQVNDYQINQKFKTAFSFGYKWQIADHISKRVPKSNTDYLPDKERTETLRRDLGDTIKWEWNIRYAINSSWGLALAYLGENKQQDIYQGSRGYDYSVLSYNTDQKSTKVEFQISFNTVKGFLKKKFELPFFVAYRYSDFLTGRNIERQNFHTLNMGMAF